MAPLHGTIMILIENTLVQLKYIGIHCTCIALFCQNATFMVAVPCDKLIKGCKYIDLLFSI